MQVCTRCKKEFEEDAHIGKSGRPFCDQCYRELKARKQSRQSSPSSQADKTAANSPPNFFKRRSFLVISCICGILLIGSGWLLYSQFGDFVVNIEDFPMRPGLRWTYSATDDRLPDESFKVIVQTKIAKDGGDLIEESYFSEGGGAKRSYVRKLRNAIVEYASRDESSLIHKFEFPAKVGSEWKLQFPGLAQLEVDLVSVAITGIEEVTVPFGTFKCLKLEADLTEIEHMSELSLWLAPDVGFVKQKLAYEHGITTVVLTDFREAGEDLWQSISPPVYHTSFDSPSLHEWLRSSGQWHVRDGVLCSQGVGSETIMLKPYVWQDCKISYRVRFISGGDAWVSFRGNYLSEPRGYSYFQLDSGSLKIRHNNLKEWKDISEIVPSQGDDKWHKVECFLNGPMVECFVDGALVVSTEQCPVDVGFVGFRTLNTKVEIDDLRIENLAEAQTSSGTPGASNLQQKSSADTHEKLQELNIPFTPKEFINRAMQGDVGIIQLFLAAGIDPNSQDKDGRTALMRAILKDHNDIAKTLIEAGADINVKDNLEREALLYAVSIGNAEMVQVLLSSGADSNTKAVSGETALMTAAHYGHADILKTLLAAGADVSAKTTEDKTALMHAIWGGDIMIINTLLDAGADVSAKTTEDKTALMYAALEGHDDIAKLLIDRGADVNAGSQTGETALSMAVSKCHPDVISSLMARGADLNTRNDDGITLLMKAAWSGCKEIVVALLERGVDVNLQGRNGETAAGLARANGHPEIAQLLEQGDANPFEIVSDQIPMQIGNKWTFTIRSGDQNLNGKSLIYSFYDSFEHEGKTYFRRRIEIPDMYERTIGLQVLEPNGWYGFWKPEDTTPYDIIRFPLSPGMKWEAEVLNEDREGNITAGHKKWFAEAEEMIEVPAGVFRSIRIRYFNNPADSNDDELVWLAPNVGLVKFTDKGGDTFNLASFRLSNTSHGPIPIQQHKQTE